MGVIPKEGAIEKTCRKCSTVFIGRFCKECRKKSTREWYLNNQALVANRRTLWALANPEKIKESKSKWKKQNPEKVREHRRVAYKANPQKGRNSSAAYRLLNLEKASNSQRKSRAKLTDGYVANTMGLNLSTCPKGLIELQRITIQIKRLIKDKS